MAFYIAEARDMGITILPPDLNASENMFTAREMSIRFGLQGIKNVGQAALESIVRERQSKLYKDLYDFCLRVDLRTVNKRVVESLIYAGAYDTLPGNRAQKLAELSTIMDQAAEAKEALLTGQMGLFGSPTEKFSDNDNFYAFTAREELSDKEKLEKEKEVVGLYISAQPLDRYKKQTTWLQAITFTQAAQTQGLVTCCGTFKSHKVITTKKGDKMAFLFLEDATTTAEIILFPKVYSRVASILEDNAVFVVKGFVDETGTGTCKIKAQELIVLDKLFEDHAIIAVTIALPEADQLTLLESIKGLMQAGKVALNFVLTDNNKKIKLATRQKITLTPQILELVEQHQLAMQLEI
jgi:DNA polymerase-3 subunit alpha